MKKSIERSGFTLLEVLVALAIAGFVFATAGRIVGTTTAHLSEEKESIVVTQLAESIWYSLSIENKRDLRSLNFSLPSTVEIEIEYKPISQQTFDGWNAVGPLDWVILRVSLNNSAINIEGVMPSSR